MHEQIQARLAKAKVALLLEHPFTGVLALGRKYVITEEIPTAAVCLKQIMFNPEFVSSLTDKELLFVLAHECMHLALEHGFRKGAREHKLWNKAGDYVINQLLVEEHLGDMPRIGLLDVLIYVQGGKTTDGIYALLSQEQEQEEYTGFDECLEEEGTPEEQHQAQAELRVAIAQAAATARMMGKLSANMERLCNSILSAKVDWRDVLQRFLTRHTPDERSFARFNRRFLGQGLLLPSQGRKQAATNFVFAVDCSGSVGVDETNQFLAELKKVKEDLNPQELHVICFDSKVTNFQTFAEEDELAVEFKGGGGTDFAPVFKEIDDRGIEPSAIVFLTDLCCSSFGRTDYPVLWVSTYETNAPFGEVIRM